MKTIFLLLFFVLPALPIAAEDLPANLLFAAQELFDRGEFETALDYYKRFQQSYPFDAKAQAVQMMIAECGSRLKIDNANELAIKEYQYVIAMTTMTALAQSARFRINEILYNQGAYVEAWHAWDKFLRDYPQGYLRAEALYSKALALAKVKNWGLVGQTLEELLKLNPAYANYDKTRLLQGLHAYGQSQYAQAVDYLQKIKDSNDASLFYLGKSYLKLGKPVFAARNFQEVLARFPESPLIPEATYLMVDSFIVAKDYFGSLANYDRFIHILFGESPWLRPLTYKIASLNFNYGNHIQAREYFKKVIDQKADDEMAAWSHFMIAESFLKEGRVKEAVFAYGDVYNNHPDRSFAGTALYKLALSFLLNEKYPEAQSHASKMIAKYPNHSFTAAAYIVLGSALARQSKYEEAVSAYQKAVDLDYPNEISQGAIALAAQTLLESQNEAGLISGYRHILNNYTPSDSSWWPYAYLFLGEGYFRSGLYAQALSVYKMVLELYPLSPAALWAQDGLAWSYFKNGQYALAQNERDKLKNYKTLTDKEKVLTEQNYYETANSYFNQKNYVKAAEFYGRFTGKNAKSPNAPQAQLRLGLAWSQMGYHGQALEVWQKLVKSYPSSPEALEAFNKMADLYFRAAQYDAAVSVYKEILKRKPKDTDLAFIQMRVAQSYFNAGKDLESVANFKRLILTYPQAPQSKEALEFFALLLEKPNIKTASTKAVHEVFQVLGSSHTLACELEFKLAQKYFEEKDYARALTELEKLSGSPLDLTLMPSYLYSLGEAYYQKAKYKESANAFERLIANFGQDERLLYAFFRSGEAYFKLEDYLKAAANFTKVANEFSSSDYAPTALFNAAISYRKAGLWQEGERALLSYIAKYPDKAQEGSALMELVNLYEESKNYAKAVQTLEVLRKETNVPTATDGEVGTRLAEIYLVQGSLPQAVNEFEKLFQTLAADNPFRLNAAAKLADIHEKTESWEKALAVYQEIAKIAKKPEWAAAAKSRAEFIQANYLNDGAERNASKAGNQNQNLDSRLRGNDDTESGGTTKQ